MSAYPPELVDAVAAELAQLAGSRVFEIADFGEIWILEIREAFRADARRILDVLDARGALLRADADFDISLPSMGREVGRRTIRIHRSNDDTTQTAADAHGGSGPAAGAATSTPDGAAAPAPGPVGEGQAGGHPQTAKRASARTPARDGG